jgi:hypothetical protein
MPARLNLPSFHILDAYQAFFHKKNTMFWVFSTRVKISMFFLGLFFNSFAADYWQAPPPALGLPPKGRDNT